MEFQLRARVVVSSPFKGLSAYATGRKLKGPSRGGMANGDEDEGADTISRRRPHVCMCAYIYLYILLSRII